MTHECHPRRHDNGQYRCMDGECRKRFIPIEDAYKHVDWDAWIEVITQEDVEDEPS